MIERILSGDGGCVGGVMCGFVCVSACAWDPFVCVCVCLARLMKGSITDAVSGLQNK